MLAKTLKRIVDKQFTSAKEISELTGVSQSTVYRWIAGQSQPDFDSVRLLVRLLPDARAQKELILTFAAGTDWHVTKMELELDINADGKIDAADALDSSIDAVHSSGKNLKLLRTAFRDGMANPEQVLELIHLLQNTAGHCMVTQQVLVHLAEKNKRRKLKLVR